MGDKKKPKPQPFIFRSNGVIHKEYEDGQAYTGVKDTSGNMIFVGDRIMLDTLIKGWSDTVYVVTQDEGEYGFWTSDKPDPIWVSLRSVVPLAIRLLKVK